MRERRRGLSTALQPGQFEHPQIGHTLNAMTNVCIGMHEPVPCGATCQALPTANIGCDAGDQAAAKYRGIVITAFRTLPIGLTS